MILRQFSTDRFAFFCPGCDDLHTVDATWEFNGDYEKPSFRPSIYVWTYSSVCHSFITNGKILFLKDSTHALSEQTVPLPPLPLWFTQEEQENATKAEQIDSDRYYYPDEDAESVQYASEINENDEYWTA